MDNEDREHFKTIASVAAKPQTDLSRQQNGASLQSHRDQASCLQKARTIFGCYRRDEAHDPEIFTAALAAILGDYPASVVDYAADPRTGVITEFPMGLPNVGQVREFLDAVDRRMKIMALPKAIPKPFVPPPLLPGQITYDQFLELQQQGKVKSSRPTGRFEQLGDKWNRGIA